MLNKGDFELYGIGGESIQAKAIGTYMLKLLSGKILELENFYYMPKIIKNIISVPLVLQRGYEINGKSNSYSIYFLNEIFYHGIINNGLLILFNIIFFILTKAKNEKEKK